MSRDGVALDVYDITEAADNLGALFLLSPLTKAGAELKRVVYEQLERRQKLAENLASRCKTLDAEVEGLRAQNERLTQQLQEREKEVEDAVRLLKDHDIRPDC